METKIKNLEFNTEFNILFVNEEKMDYFDGYTSSH